MSCRDTIHLICWYLEGKLSPSVRREIERHLSTCADCNLVLKAATNTLDRYFSEPEPVTAEAATEAA
jgi:anti-sigma factor RsiW